MTSVNGTRAYDKTLPSSDFFNEDVEATLFASVEFGRPRTSPSRSQNTGTYGNTYLTD